MGEARRRSQNAKQAAAGDPHGGVTQVSERIQGAGGLRLAEPLRARIARQAR